MVEGRAKEGVVVADGNWAESLFTESVKGAFGATGTIFGVIGAVVATQLPQGRACGSGVFARDDTPCGIDLLGKVDVPFAGWMLYPAAVGVLAFVGVLVGLVVGGIGVMAYGNKD